MKLDLCLYISKTVWLLIYVDDCTSRKIINVLQIEFQARNIRKIKNFLGTKISRKEKHLKITEEKQIEKILETFKMVDSKEI